MLVVVPAEIKPGERRVAATPETVKKIIAKGHAVRVQAGAGVAANIPDDAFAQVGAEIVSDAATLYAGADLVLKVHGPDAAELAQIPANAALIAMLSPYGNPLISQYANHPLTAFALELVPRISRAQSMDVLSSQANIAGYRAVLLATHYYRAFFPMLMTAAGTVNPAKVLVLGAGVAGLQAIATARRLGAVVEVFDVRAAAKEQVESLGAKFVEVPSEEKGEGSGGYAREMSDDYKRQQSELLARHVAKADIIITTALIPGRPAPVLVTPEMVQTMKPGAVLVDMAVASGGNCPLSKLDEVVEVNGVTLVGESNLPSLMSADASRLYARNLLNLLDLMMSKEERLAINRDDEIIAGCLICQGGELLKPQFASQGGTNG